MNKITIDILPNVSPTLKNEMSVRGNASRGCLHPGEEANERIMTKGELTKIRLLKCAEEAFSEKGYYETQVSDIVKLGRVAKGTIYQYFKNKEDVFTTLLESYVQEWEKAIAVNMRDFGGDLAPIHYAISYLHHRLMRTAIYFRENEDRTNIILRISVGVNQAFEQVIRQFEDKVLGIIVHDIKLGQKWGNIPADVNIEMASNAILGATLRLSFYFFVLHRKKYLKVPVDSMVDEGVKLVAQMLRMK